ncbi:MAG: putative metal-dependent hydrolase [Bacteroidetes bacterium]|nr:putative metal-dependent hydrolase [Bacteroidota bacterium]
MSDLENLKYPVGRFKPHFSVSEAERLACIEAIAACPEKLVQAVNGLSTAQFDTPYREGGWTVRQLVHHLFDSHANAFIRVRLALTEENPRVTAYDQNAWAHLPDSVTAPPEISVALLAGLHQRWVITLEAMSMDQYGRTLDHPENGPMTLDLILQMYAWHGLHHVRHISALRERMGW